MQQNFVHLRLHTEYSIVDGLIKINPLFKSLSKMGMNAVAITDFCNLFATVKFYNEALSSGIKPIIGCEFPCHTLEQPEITSSILLLCQNEIGYKNLTCLVSKAYQEGQYHGEPRVQYGWLKEHSEGLIALSGGRMGSIGKALLAEDENRANLLAKKLMNIFKGRFYLEIQRTGRRDEALYNKLVVKIADELNLPLVATNDVHFLTEDDFYAHEARVCIHEGYTLNDPRRNSIYSQEQYLRTKEEMAELFPDLPQALANTVEIAKRCSLNLNLGHNYLPNFPIPDGSTVASYLTHLAESGLNERLAKIEERRKLGHTDILYFPRDEYDKRLKLEIDVINSMGFSGYFLIVADFIKWAIQNGVPVGPGRGSGAGSLVAYVLRITDLDPLQYDLLFERFLNPERVSMPDFDIDFCMEGRDRVIDYVAEKYGRQAVSQIITFGTMAAKAVIRDVGRVLGHPYGFVDKLAKLIPFELGITLEKAMVLEEELKKRYHEEEEVKELFDLALKLEGITRNAGKHAGGVVIAPSKLTDFTAIYCEEGSTQIVSQFDKDDVEAVGLVKFDFLGLRTLTIIDWALTTINNRLKKESLPLINISEIPLNDEKTYELLKSCQTTAVFQLESRGMKELIGRLKPDCFEDIIALVALFRPGPLQSGMVDDFIDRKHGRAVVQYMHPSLEQILKPTYGIILYQEQVMQIAQVLANYTLGAADLLRRAMGKKKPEEMASQRAIFTDGASSRGIDETVSTNIFDLIEKFAGYGFNKSHSAAYALVSYQTAWLKTHFSAEFMAAVISSDLDNTEKVVNFIRECKSMNLKVLPPSINSSYFKFTVLDSATIIYGLGAIKGLGELAIQCVVEDREKNGPFEGLFSFCQRLDLRKVNRRALEALIKSGAMDDFGVERAVLFTSIEKALSAGTKFHISQKSGQQDIFSLMDDILIEDYVSSKPWQFIERLDNEKDTLGFYLTGHPAEPYLQEFKGFINPVAKLNYRNTKKTFVCGLVNSVRRILTKRGKKLAIINLEDSSGMIDIVAFSEIFEEKANLVVTGKIIVVEGELGQDNYTGGVKITAMAISSLDEARTRFAKFLAITITEGDNTLIPRLQSLFKEHGGDCVVQIRYANKDAKAAINLAANWCVNPSDDLLNTLVELLDEARVEVCY